jgi:PAS domain S-box-containing protein
MEFTINSRSFKAMRRDSRSAGLIVLGYGFAGLAGGLIAGMRNLSGGLPLMTPLTAISFVLAGFSLWLTGSGQNSPSLHRAAIFCMSAVVIGATLTLGGYLLNFDAGLARLLPSRVAGRFRALLPGPSLLTALNFLLIGVALLQSGRGIRGRRIKDILSVTVVLICLLALIGYILDVPSFYGWRSLIPTSVISLHECLAFTVLALGVLCVHPENGLMRIIFSSTTSGVLARRLLLAPVIIPLVTGGLQTVVLKTGIYNGEFASWLFAFLNIYIFTVAIWWSAVSLHRSNAARTRTEEESERFFTLSLDMLCIAGMDGYFKRLNPAFSQTLGFSISELLSRPFLLFVHPEDRVATLAELKKLNEGGQTSQFENRYLCKDGTWKWLSWKTKPFAGEALLYAAARDITERRESEAALCRARDELEERVQERTAALDAANGKFRDLVEQSIVGIYAIQDGRFAYVNPKMVEIFGFTAEELTSRPVVNFIVEEDRPLATENIRKRIQGRVRQIRYSLRMLRADGSIMDVEVHGVRSELNGRVAILGTMLDVTVRKHAEETIRRAHAELEERVRDGIQRTLELENEIVERRRMEQERDRFFTLSLDILCIIGMDGFFKRINPAFQRLLGYDEEYLLSRPVLEFVHPEDLESSREGLQALATGAPMANFEHRCQCRDGSYRWIAWSSTPVPEESVIYSYGRDITERRRSEEEMVRMNGQLLDVSRQAGMAEVATSVLHNVGNVLNSVNVSCSVISDKLRRSRISSVHKTAQVLQQHQSDLPAFFATNPTGQKLPKFLTKLALHLSEEQAAVLSELESLSKNIHHINDIVAMQQSHAKNIGGVRETLPLDGLVEDALRLNGDSLVRHKVQIVREFNAVEPVSLEKHKVMQILVNLLRNAKHALKDSDRSDKRLVIRIHRDDDRVLVSLCDNGVGIPPENLTRIFAHGYTTKPYGHGFGLHSGVLAAQEMGGRLTAYSEGRGTGATFTLELPLRPVPCQKDP